MKLLTSTLPHVRELLRPSGWFTLGIVIALLGLETLGRMKTDSDLQDGMVMCGLLLVGFVVVQRHRQQPLAWLSAFIRFVEGIGHRCERLFRMELGLDLRGNPPITRKMPLAIMLIFAGLVGWNLVALAGWYFFPDGWRTMGVRFFYLGYLLGLMGLWVMLFSALLVGVYLPLSLVYQWVLTRDDGETQPRYGMMVLIGYLGFVIVAESLLPPSLVLYLCGAVLAVALIGVIWPSRAEIQFIWRGETGGPVWSLPSLRMIAAACVLGILLITGLVLSSAGGRVIGNPDAESKMPLTVLMGSALAWLTPGMILAAVTVLAMVWWRNPARQTAPTLYVRGRVADRKAAFRILRTWGYRVRWADKVPSGAVAIELVEEERSEATEFDPRWPLRVSLADLQAGRVRERIERRDELQLRRQLFRGLETLFKQGSARKSKGGSGYWLAPHLWFVSGLTRDEPEPDDDGEDGSILLRIIGTPYHRLYARRVRQYLYRVLRTMQIDLVFVEDGVNYRKLCRVLRAMFEVYDRHAGERRAEEIQFAQVPKVRVLIHEFQIDQPFRSEVYPEPKFEDLGRARILHVFRDRGGQEDPLDAPWDFESSPSPMAFA